VTKTMYARYAIIIGGVAILFGALSGCSLDDLIRVNVPKSIQEQTGLPASITLREAEYEFDQWQQRVVADGIEWRNRIGEANRVRAVLSHITMQSAEQYAPFLNMVPGGGAILPVLSTGLALFLRRPGDSDPKGLAKEKNASFNKGIEEGKRLAIEALSATQRNTPNG
jgi:hypothetical protein